jgi:hypothetical protein
MFFVIVGWLDLFGQTSSREVLTNDAVRVEIIVRAGRVQEEFFAKGPKGWVKLAVSDGDTLGALCLHDANGVVKTGTVLSVVRSRSQIAEDLEVAGLKIQRVISLTPDARWLRALTRVISEQPVRLHSFFDRFRTPIHPDWAFSPSVGGFNPDAMYKAPLILVQAEHSAFGIVPDVLSLDRNVLGLCNHALDLDVPAGPKLAVGFIPAEKAYHTVFQEDVDRTWFHDGALENSYYLYLSDAAPLKEAFRDAVRFHWEHFARTELVHAADEQSGTAPQYAVDHLWDDWRQTVWQQESRDEWISFVLPDGSVGGAVKMLHWSGADLSANLGAWFNSLRTAYGMALYARRKQDPQLMALAQQTLQMALKAPGREGAFKCFAVIGVHLGDVKWGAGDGYAGGVERGFLGFDMAWTGYWLLKWREAQLPGSPAILDRCKQLAEFLIARRMLTECYPHDLTKMEQSKNAGHAWCKRRPRRSRFFSWSFTGTSQKDDIWHLPGEAWHFSNAK